jgi:hypothetical protein
MGTWGFNPLANTRATRKKGFISAVDLGVFFVLPVSFYE